MVSAFFYIQYKNGQITPFFQKNAREYGLA